MIYFITAPELRAVKIGLASNPQERFHICQVHSPVALVLDRVTEGGKSDEAELHHRFADHRLRGEWFSLVPEIEAFMESLPRHIWRHRGWHHAAKRAARNEGHCTAEELMHGVPERRTGAAA